MEMKSGYETVLDPHSTTKCMFIGMSDNESRYLTDKTGRIGNVFPYLLGEVSSIFLQLSSLMMYLECLVIMKLSM